MKIISSFSGGKTSAYMTIKLKKKYPDLIVLFANTSQENDETLEFVNKCDKEYNLGVIWLEAVVHHGERKACTHKITNFYDAKRKGEVFEEIIKKYGIPNLSFIHCTRELKLHPIKSWIRVNLNCEYKMSIGIRLDEQIRISSQAEMNKLFYPLIDWRIIKQDINEFWRSQVFNLNLENYQGNCKTCFKKREKKLLMIAKENPEFFDFNLKMEKKYGFVGPEFEKYGIKEPRVFFEKKTSTVDLLKKSKSPQTDMMDYIDNGYYSPCSESCEAFT
jgi:3'-phosphoadenosine 5'-phosphosulfate sulfotransferase (PAPS reductase)/FAD synthetase